VQRYRAEGIPIRYLQLDSWWYYKTYTDPDGRTGKPKNERLPLENGIATAGSSSTRRTEPVPDGSGGISAAGGLPLIAHNRWIDPASPYHQRYRISGLRHSTRTVAGDHRLPVIRKGRDV